MQQRGLGKLARHKGWQHHVLYECGLMEVPRREIGTDFDVTKITIKAVAGGV